MQGSHLVLSKVYEVKANISCSQSTTSYKNRTLRDTTNTTNILVKDHVLEDYCINYGNRRHKYCSAYDFLMFYNHEYNTTPKTKHLV
jgi:hypothetical protein